jgi:hypothetical protein
VLKAVDFYKDDGVFTVFHDVYPCETVFIMYMQTMQSKSSSGSIDMIRSNGQLWLYYDTERKQGYM